MDQLLVEITDLRSEHTDFKQVPCANRHLYKKHIRPFKYTL